MNDDAAKKQAVPGGVPADSLYAQGPSGPIAPSSAVGSAPVIEQVVETTKSNKGQSYWDLVWLQYKKRTEALVGLILLVILFLIALTAPLIANNLPWILKDESGTSFPLVRDFLFPLEALDRFYNSALVALILTGIVWFLGRSKAKRRDATDENQKAAKSLNRRLPRMFCGALVILFAISTYVGGKNDRTDYKALKESGKATVVFTIVPWGSLEDAPERSDNGPTNSHPLGCDNNGFDVLSRIIHGSRISLAVGFLAIGLAVSIGTIVGSLSGYYGGWVDLLASRVIEVFICFPSFFLILTIIAVAPRRSIFWVMFAIGLTGWMGVARLIRGEVLKVRQLDYVSAARAVGSSNSRIVFRHILPNAIAPVLVAATFGVAGAILSETGLGFLGLGVEPPTPSWGELLNQARQDPERLWWLMIYPGFMIFLSVTLMNLVGEGLRDAMDPKLRK